MTLVMGLNLSHKLYLAGDTRVTRRISDGSHIYIDNVLKVVPLWGKGIRDQKFHNNDSISVAVAGDVAFATYLYKKIGNALNLNMLSSDIRKLSDTLEPFLKERVDLWLRKHPHSVCCLLFAGVSAKRKKRISKEKLEELLLLFEKRREEDRPNRERFRNEVFPNDPTFQLLDKKMREDSGRGVLEALDEGNSPKFSKWIEDALAKGTEEIDMPDSLIVGIVIDTASGVFKREVAEWGEFLAYGARLKKEDLPSDIVATLELSHIKDERQNPAMMEGAILTTTILDTAKKRNIGTIGGTVVLISSLADGNFYIQGKDLRNMPNGEYCLEFYGQKVPLMPFHKVTTVSDSGEVLKLDAELILS